MDCKRPCDKTGLYGTGHSMTGHSMTGHDNAGHDNAGRDECRAANRLMAARPAASRRTFLLAAGAGLAGAGIVGGGMAPVRSRADDEPAAVAKVRLPSVEELRGRSADLWQLVDLINAYRDRHKLPNIALSPRLTAVAWLHCHDLEENMPHRRHGSLHSWSEDMRWSGGAYLPQDKETWPLMWNKPKEIAAYQGFGFEVAASEVRDRRHALEVWQQSQPHNNVLLNRDVWSNPRWQWKALGAVFYKGYAAAWFGDKPDPA